LRTYGSEAPFPPVPITPAASVVRNSREKIKATIIIIVVVKGRTLLPVDLLMDIDLLLPNDSFTAANIR